MCLRSSYPTIVLLRQGVNCGLSVRLPKNFFFHPILILESHINPKSRLFNFRNQMNLQFNFILLLFSLLHFDLEMAAETSFLLIQVGVSLHLVLNTLSLQK